MRSHLRLIAILSGCLVLLAAAPRIVEAQRRARPAVRRPVVRSVVLVGGYYYPRYAFYDPWFQPWGAYPLYGPYGYGYGYGYPVRDNTSALRLDVTPRDAQVIVDGYSAGTVDDFDGVFQRLRLRPGEHEITFYLEGFRTIRENLYVNPGSDKKIHETMERLAAGERSEPPPQPATSEPDETVDGRGPAPRPRSIETEEPRPAPGDERDRRPGPRRAQPSEFGTLEIRVQPEDADILIDGQGWSAHANQDRTTLQLSTGRHHIDVRKSGLTTYSEDVLIRTGHTLTLNVNLSVSPVR